MAAQNNVLSTFDDLHDDKTKGLRWSHYQKLILTRYKVELPDDVCRNWSRGLKGSNRRTRKKLEKFMKPKNGSSSSDSDDSSDNGKKKKKRQKT